MTVSSPSYAKILRSRGTGTIITALQGQLALSGKWRATQVREALVPAARKVIELASLTPSLAVYDTLLEREVAHVG